jgi:hypothetical protein
MPHPQTLILAKDLGSRQYDEIADRVSMHARHLLWFLLEVAEAGQVRKDKLKDRITQSGHAWTEEELASYLKELSAARCFDQPAPKP